MNDGDWRQPSRQQADRGARLCSAGGGRPWLRPLGFSTVWLPTRLSAPDAQSAQRPTAAIFWRSPAAAIGQLYVSSIGADFYAFAVETTGRLGPGALAFIRRLIQEGARFKNVDAPKEVVNGIYRSVAVALARGNADIVQANLTRSRLAEW